ncbi:MAG: XrtA/PEP-CTERM system exopolysaccharide export protein [Gammaproteobacteria bacterium]
MAINRRITVAGHDHCRVRAGLPALPHKPAYIAVVTCNNIGEIFSGLAGVRYMDDCGKTSSSGKYMRIMNDSVSNGITASARALAGSGLLLFLAIAMLAGGCATTLDAPPATTTASVSSPDYIIGPGDTLRIFVWRNPDVSAEVPVRPDGKISTPLVEDMQAVGKTPTQLARDIEQDLGRYLKNPVATVTVIQFVGNFNEQIRVVGQALEPRALTYRDDLSLLDVMIEVGGLSEFAAGNGAKLVRRSGSGRETLGVRLEDLLNKGDMSANVEMQPGDIVVIPESWF